MQQHHTDIAVIGAGITGLTLAFHLQRAGKQVQLLERDNRPGGQIRTYQEKGFTFESGPNTGVISNPEVAGLFALLDPGCRLSTACEDAARRLIWKKGRFHELPSGLWGGITTPLFSWPDKLRILGEPFRPKGTNPDESVGELTVRRLGRSFLNYAVDPFISGIYAGDPMQLVTRFALPKLYNLEQQYGSFIRGAIQKARQPKTEQERLATRKVFSAGNGMEELPKALAHLIGERNITLNVDQLIIQPSEKNWQLRYQVEGEQHHLTANQVITTTGAYSLAGYLPFIPDSLIEPATRLRYAPIIQVAVGIKEVPARQPHAFGGLIPSGEKQDMLGILFPSACFPDRAPAGSALYSYFLGGIRHPEMINKTDKEIEAIIRKSLSNQLGYPEGIQPDLLRIFRHPQAIPQYDKESEARLEAIHQIESTWPGLTLAGNIRDGIGLADRIRQATLLAEGLSPSILTLGLKHSGNK